MQTLQETVALLAQGVGIGTILALLFERIPALQNVSSDTKWWIVFVASVALPAAATALLQFVPAETWALLEPYWHAIALGFLTWGGSQVAHKLDKNYDRR